MPKVKGWVALVVVTVLGVVLYKVYTQRKLDLTLAHLVDEGADLEKVAPLLQRGANPNARVRGATYGGGTYSVPVLLLAYERGRMDVFKLLLDKGADPNFTTSWGATVLARVALNLGDPPGRSYKAVKLLIARGANVNALNSGLSTPLVAASGGGSLPTVKLLLEKGAKVSINARSPDYGMTALMLAADRGQVEIVKVLLEAGADPSLKDNKGRTALDCAKEKGRSEVIKLLEKPSRKVRRAKQGNESSER